MKFSYAWRVIAAALMVLQSPVIFSQKVDIQAIAAMISAYKREDRGPYKDIRWFCKDGSTRPPQERCPEPGAQRARYKDEVVNLGRTNHVFLGQILATSDFADFWDEPQNHSRTKQYLLEEYLKRSDNGWIMRKAQFYRGAVQAEDEEAWGLEFYKWLLQDNKMLGRNFLLIRESARNIPHRGDDSQMQKIRSLSKEIADTIPSFMNLRVKIHGHPGPEDMEAVKEYLERNTSKLPPAQEKKLNLLIQAMELHYQPVDMGGMKKFLAGIPRESAIYQSCAGLMAGYPQLDIAEKVIGLSDLLLEFRQAMPSMPSGTGRLALLDISLRIEEILFREQAAWKPISPGELLQKTGALIKASAGCGYIELWEWDAIKSQLELPPHQQVPLVSLNAYFLASRRVVDWGSGMYRGTFKDAIELYSGFEPLSKGFLDDRIRSTLLLPLGDCITDLGEFIGNEANLKNNVMGIREQGQIRGLNPGIALGELVVLDELAEDARVSGDKIYIISHPPADLKPVAGIATVTEGNMVSHVQLLARNLAIPNAVISAQNLEQLRAHQGRKVFYAVSEKGTVVMKPADQMSTEEKKLFEVKKRSGEQVHVPTDRIDLEETRILNLREIGAGHSGIVCGPKAANLGHLKTLFPDHVVEGLVIPFGIFKAHMDQLMPGKSISYWDFLNTAFEHAGSIATQEDADAYLINELALLRDAIKAMPMLPGFVDELTRSFAQVLGGPIGRVPVFLRSDTNMEDLKDFTGAGLNLTLFNVLDQEKIIQGIKDVWASPYSERSYKWRQRYLLNPQHVYPSILIIPTVNVDRSGVLITKGIPTGDEEGLTVAFSRGAGGAVEGQAAESWHLLPDGGHELLSPAREPYYTTLPATGGTEKKSTTFEKPLLGYNDLDLLRAMAENIKVKMNPGNGYAGPWDIELGFTGNRLWLFQIRPFVENKNAGKIEYLNSISPDIPEGRTINLKSTF